MQLDLPLRLPTSSAQGRALRDWPLHFKARDTLSPLSAVWMSPLLRGLDGQAAGAPSIEHWEQQAWLLICCSDNSHAQFDIL